MECKLHKLTINYEIIGEGKPIIMIHGYCVDHNIMKGCMEPIFKNLEGYKRIYFDLPGMGDTKSSEYVKSADDMLNIILEFIDKVIPGERFLVSGQSYGGYLARGVINKKEDLVDGMALICPVIIAERSKRELPLHKVIVEDKILLDTLESKEAEEVKANFVVQSREIYERYKKELASGIEKADIAYLMNIQEKAYEFSFDVDNLPYKFNKPSLMILGRQDAVVGYKDAFKVIDSYERCTLAVLDAAGHSLQLEQKNLFEIFIKDWLSRI